MSNSSEIRRILFLAKHSLSANYRNTKIGLQWITISTALLVLVKVIVFSGLDFSEDFNVFLVSGFMCFAIIRYSVLEGAKLLIQFESIILGGLATVKVVIASFLVRVTIFSFFLSWPLFVWIILFNGFSLFAAISFIGFMICNLLLAFVSSVLLGFLSVIYKDLPHLLGSFFSVIFFVTPILWMPEGRPERVFLNDVNPIAWLIDVFRTPLMKDEWGNNQSIVVLIIIILTFIAISVYRRKHNEIVIRL
jgi:ABC-type polysaccharide/polyol phosphate export permease